MINKLEKLARAATPGDWKASDAGNVRTNVDSKRDTFFICSAGGDIDDAAYIAAANPQTVLKLCEVIRTLRDALGGFVGNSSVQVAFPTECEIAEAALAKANEVMGGE
jgi:hypothetical protein